MRRLVGNRNIIAVVVAVTVVVGGRGGLVGGIVLRAGSLFLPCPRRGLFGRGGRGYGHEEVDFSALELGVGRHDEDLGATAAVGGGGGRGLLEDVLGVGAEDVGSADGGAADLLYAAVDMDDADHVEGSAGENAGDATPYGVLHGEVR
ncbi:hypothetical protein Acr_06g0008990 [Actinidia rufa]|uniref:Uncharacterized protein n=1 Tax=Actinidia rufa TaxID=165716 RepID=A0A7J0ESI4_9ERIC|nr:hypothetical protein Acr_06g0008990 [Actinidia rufa]